MANPENKITELVDIMKSWIPRRTESTNVSRDFWMPDQSCRVCYECDSQFTVFNRRHHCRLCGRVFCAKCTASSIPAPSDDPRIGNEDWERIRVCNYCFKQWQQENPADDDGTNAASSPVLSRSPSAASLVSTKSSCTCNSSGSTVGSTPYSTGPYQRVTYGSDLSPKMSAQKITYTVEQDNGSCGRTTDASTASLYSSGNHFECCSNRSDEEDDEYGSDPSVPERRHLSHAYDYYGPETFDDVDRMYGPHEMIHGGDQIDSTSICYSQLPENFNSQGDEIIKNDRDEAYDHDSDECADPSYSIDVADAEPVDFENNGMLWLPPEPEDVEDEREDCLFDDASDEEDVTGEWGYLRHSKSFSSCEYRLKDKSNDGHRKKMKNMVECHLRALIAQFLRVENISAGYEDDKENWLKIITSLSWEAATLLKPDTSKGGGMDPGGYVKVKCIACGRRSESMVVRGVVCKKNVAHRRMMSKVEKARLLILGGALEYQRVSNHLSSVDTLLQQEMDHLKMAVAKIASHHPNVLLVEKSVSRFAQEYLLAKGISLVLNIKRPLLERIARCTGAQIVPSIDHLSSQKLGCCDLFHVEKFIEEYGSAGKGGKKLTKNLMFFEGCPRPLGYTILLKGGNIDELKKVKEVVQLGVFAAYHLALETSFLADEGASLPELPLNSPITVALPDKSSSLGRSISTIPGFAIPGAEKPSDSQPKIEIQQSIEGVVSNRTLPINVEPCSTSRGVYDSTSPSSNADREPSLSSIERNNSSIRMHELEQNISDPSRYKPIEKDVKFEATESFQGKQTNPEKASVDNSLSGTSFVSSEKLEKGFGNLHADANAVTVKTDCNNLEDIGSSKEEFPPSPSDHQSILVSLSTRCVWKGTVCERAHLIRIKFYGSFDKPLGRYLQDHLFDQNYRCGSCEMPSEAHVYCYTHRRGSLTISVKKLPEFLLPGERDGKIWMWHRCLRCPRTNGFPPATRRIVMSDAAWGLSFGKFLELSFSNHAAASRVASCGHSLQRDCLRFYGFGRMVACFRYASINIHSVFLPPSKVEFNYDNQEWIQKEANEVQRRADLLFIEVQNSLCRILEKNSGVGTRKECAKGTELTRLHVKELERILQKEKEEFEESMHNTLSDRVKGGQPAVDILEINKLRRQMLFHSYVWDQRLIYAGRLRNSNIQESQIPKFREKRVNSFQNFVAIEDVSSKPIKGSDSACMALQPDLDHDQEGSCNNVSQTNRVHRRGDKNLDLNSGGEAGRCLDSSADTEEKSDLAKMRRVLSEGEFPLEGNLSDTLDAAWTGKNHVPSVTIKDNAATLPDSTAVNTGINTVEKGGNGVSRLRDLASPRSVAIPFPDIYNPFKRSSSFNAPNTETSSSVAIPFPDIYNPFKRFSSFNAPYTETSSPVAIPFPDIYKPFKRSPSFNAQKLGIGEYNPVYISLFRELEQQSGANLLLPVGVNDIVIPVYEDEPTSIVAYALMSSDYHAQMSEVEKRKNPVSTAVSLPLFDSVTLLSLNSFDESTSDIHRSLGSSEESILSVPRGSQASDKDFHARVSFTDDSSQGKVKYTVTCYYAKRFEALRRIFCPSELDFVRSISRCKKWGAQGGKSNVFFAKTLDDRFIIKQVTKTELESFIKFGPAYFKYISESISTRSPTCLAKILGIYQVSSKNLRGGKESRMDVLVMENLLFRRNVARLYDLKGSSRSRYNPDTSGSNKVLLDQNLIEAMATSPIFVGSKAKRLLERAVWNDTSFLASIDVMDYSLLAGIDEKKQELVVGIIDFVRQYTWDKHLETWVKTSGILGGSKNTTPTVISPQQYKKRFRKAMTAYFLMVPDQWSPPTVLHPSRSQSDLGEENFQ